MGNEETYWERWEKLLEAASDFQRLLPEAVLIGGSAAAVHVQHRYSFDADHILSDLEQKYQDVVDFLENRDDWKTARLNPPKLILGNFRGVETGIRQLRRNFPLETETVIVNGKKITVPTVPEMIRTKAWMIISRNAARDYIDFTALAEHLGLGQAVTALEKFDFYYSDLTRRNDVSPLIQLIRQLAEPNPHDLDDIDITHYKGIRSPLDSWVFIKKICGNISVELGEWLARSG